MAKPDAEEHEERLTPPSGIGLTAVCTLHPQSDGTVTRDFLANEVAGITTYYDGDPRPARAGDTVSVQPGGALQGRAPGANGNYERATRDGFLLFYQPGGDTNTSAPEYVYSVVKL